MSVATTLLSLLAFLVLTAGTALFVAAEFSLTALERSVVEANARDGGSRDRMVQRAHRTLSTQLSGAQIGISITTLITGLLAQPVIARLLEPLFESAGLSRDWSAGLSLALALLIATSVSMVYGELVPKNLAVARPVATARASAGPQVLFSALFMPLIRLTNGVANRILRRVGIEPAEELRSARSAQELVSLVRNSARHGSLEPATALLVDRSLQFGTRTAEELMTPRSRIVALEADSTVADLVAAATKTGFSRFPVVEGDLDQTIGLVHVKQVFEVPLEARCNTVLASLAQPVLQVPSTLDGDSLMTQIRGNGLQTALVADEYGGTAGMVTAEDLIEEIVGDVRDEHDVKTPDVLVADRGWQVSGLLRTDEVADATGFRAPEGEYETIGGLVLQELGHIPVEGETVKLRAFDPDGPIERPVLWLAKVLTMDGRRIDQLSLTELGRDHVDRGDADG